jgi:prolyl-tRNA editing enzyme YbaK/EbsC (Cys-tRNA(Pro) deacylase)
MSEALSDAEIGERVVAVLDGLGAAYEVMHIDPALADTAEFCAHYGIPLEQSANTIIVASKKEPRQYCACLVLATTRLDVNHAVRKLMGVSRVSFASGDETKAVTGMLIGGVTIFALPAELPIYVDERVMAPDWIIVGGGGRSTKLKLAPGALRRLPNVKVVPGLAADIPGGSS